MNQELFDAIQVVCEWENDYRTLNHLGRNPPQCFAYLATLAARVQAEAAPRCQARHPEEGQCELREGHYGALKGKHLAGTAVWGEKAEPAGKLKGQSVCPECGANYTNGPRCTECKRLLAGDGPGEICEECADGVERVALNARPAGAVKGEALWKCKARAANMGANDPQDCDWPVCGCDPYADKVIAALQESGKLADAPLREAAERRQIECQAILDLMGKEPYLAKGHVENGEYKWTVVADKISVTELFAAPAEGKPHK